MLLPEQTTTTKTNTEETNIFPKLSLAIYKKAKGPARDLSNPHIGDVQKKVG